jgi:hypothetical protein
MVSDDKKYAQDEAPISNPPWTRADTIRRDIEQMNAAGHWFRVEVEMTDGMIIPGKVQIVRSTGDADQDLELAKKRLLDPNNGAFRNLVHEVAHIRHALPPGTKRQKPWEAEGISRASWYRRQKA